MPKRINSRVANNSALGKSNIHSNTGNIIGNNTYNNIINSVNNLAKIELLKKIDNTYNKDISIEDTMILTYNHIIFDNGINQHSEIVKNYRLNNDCIYDYINKHNCIKPIPIHYLDNLYYEFILQYLNISPLEIGTVDKYNEIINYINNILNTDGVTDYNQIVLKIYRDSLVCLFKARKDYVDLIAINNEIQFIKNKYDELNLLNINILNDLKLFAGSNGIAYSTMNYIKPAIYMQALFDINLAWYQYIYKTSDINPDLYNYVRKFVKSFGTRKNAYNTLIDTLNKTEMYTDHYNINYTYNSWFVNKNIFVQQCDDSSGNDTSLICNDNSNVKELIDSKLKTI